MSSFPARDLVARFLQNPSVAERYSPADFDLMHRQALASGLMGRVHAMAHETGLLTEDSPWPVAFRRHLAGAGAVVRAHHAQVLREVEFLRQALQPLGLPVILLKGAAYVAAGLSAGKGRVFGDVDILVPRTQLDEVENALMVAGWVGEKQHAYDQRYYREWMHELPPMTHIRRQTSLDVHHAIVPLTSRWRSLAAPLLDAAVAIPGRPGVATLAPTDRVLHSMVHLLMNEETRQGLRDLSDLDLLLRDGASQTGFWSQLTERADQLGLGRALHHGLWCAAELMLTPVPEAVRERLASCGPPTWQSAVLRAAWRRGLCAQHSSTRDAWTGAALALIYTRAHALRMPTWMLVRHLLAKAFRRSESDVGASRA